MNRETSQQQNKQQNKHWFIRHKLYLTIISQQSKFQRRNHIVLKHTKHTTLCQMGTSFNLGEHSLPENYRAFTQGPILRLIKNVQSSRTSENILEQSAEKYLAYVPKSVSLSPPRSSNNPNHNRTYTDIIKNINSCIISCITKFIEYENREGDKYKIYNTMLIKTNAREFNIFL